MTDKRTESRFILDDAYFEDEVREGFYIPAEVKQAWGAEMEVLNEVDRVCCKYDIKYFAAYGTLLGAVRHGGIIPWDDDFDITMTRDNYNKFMEVWKSEFPEGFDVINYKTHPHHIYFISNVVGRSRICFEKEHLEKFHGFPYIAGVDVFVLDNRSKDAEYEKYRMETADKIIKIADCIFNKEFTGQQADNGILWIEEKTGESIPQKLRKSKGVDLRIYLYSVAERWFAAVPDKDSSELTQVMPWGINGKPYVFPKSYFDKSIDIPFENGTIPAIMQYTEMLRKNFGDYMKIKKEGTAHAYPFFDGQREDLKKVLDFEMPEYRYDAKTAGRAGLSVYNKENSYKVLASEVAAELCKICSKIPGRTKAQNYENESENDAALLLADIQQVAIDLGNYIEKIKGEGYITVNKIEKLCEMVYEYSIAYDENQDAAALYTMKENIQNLCESIRSDIENRKETVFMPFKAEYFDAMRNEYEKALAEDNTDVYIVPIPYYYKNYDGTLKKEQYDTGKYTNEKITRYTDYDFSIHRPEKIVIQNPYDEYNSATSVLPEHYSRNLLKYTDELIYIPWFITEDFDKTDGRAYKNMRYYCTMPGVINADKVILRSEHMRQLYIDKLCEFAGADTRDIWDSKICTACSKEDSDTNDSKGIKSCKKLMYFVDLSCFMTNKNAVDKIRHSLKTMNDSCDKENLNIVWYIEPQIDKELKDGDAGFVTDYMTIMNEIMGNDRIRIMNSDTDIKKIADECDAYYGDPGMAAHYFRLCGKPVMIQDYSIIG